MPDPSRSVSCLATRQDAVRCGTVAGYAARKNGRALFSRGNSRDLVVLAQDPFKADPPELLKIQLPPSTGARGSAEQKVIDCLSQSVLRPKRPCRTACQRSTAVSSRAIRDLLRGKNAASLCSLETV
jgi:hypothetical protein